MPKLAAAAGIEYRTAHVWMRRGLLKPSIREADGTGHPALFTAADCERARRLNALRDAGLSMDGLTAIVDSSAPLRAALDAWEGRPADNIEAWFAEHPATGRPVLVTPTAKQPAIGADVE